jgi:LysM repeat protein
MNLATLLAFAPLGIGLAWLGYLIFKKDLASKSLGNILTYFIGVIIIFIAVGWLIDFYVVSWANDRLQNANTNNELQQFINTSGNIIDSSFSGTGAGGGVPLAPTAQIIPIVVTATPTVQGQTTLPPPDQARPEQQARTYVVVAGDNLFNIAQRFGTTVHAIKSANQLTYDTIYPGQVLIIPASSP